MTSLARFGPAILEKRCSNGKVLSIISRLSSEQSSGKNLSTKNRPMVTAQELNMNERNLTKDGEYDELEAPTTCCMSGCANCVWIQYAERLAERMINSEDDVRKIIFDKVEDPNMRAFLSMELRCRNLTKT